MKKPESHDRFLKISSFSVMFSLLLSVNCGGVPNVSESSSSGSSSTGAKFLDTNQQSTSIKASQEALVAGLPPLTIKKRIRRYLHDVAATPSIPTPQPPYDFTNTPIGAEAEAVRNEIAQNLAASDWPTVPAPGKRRIIQDDFDAGVEYELELDSSEITMLLAAGEALGINNATGGQPANSDMLPAPGGSGFTTEAWAYGLDSRVPKPINSSFPIFDRVLQSVGLMNGGDCTGTLVGRRLVLTAGHCVLEPNLAPFTPSFAPRLSGSSLPFGRVSASSTFHDNQFTSNNCEDVYNSTVCGPWDWALLVLPDNAWDRSPNGTPGWMGYWVPGTAWMETSVLHDDGYPECGWADSPAGCCVENGLSNGCPENTVGFVPYGRPTNQFSSAIDFVAPDPNDNNFPLNYQTSDDTSEGHSGSGNWTDYPGPNGPYVVGIMIFDNCAVDDGICAQTDVGRGDAWSHPSEMRSMSPWLAGFITSERSANP